MTLELPLLIAMTIADLLSTQQCSQAAMLSKIICKKKSNFRTHALLHPFHDKCILLTPSVTVCKLLPKSGKPGVQKQLPTRGVVVMVFVCLCMWWCHGKDPASNVNNSQVAEAGGHCHKNNVRSHSLVSSPRMHSSSNRQQLDLGFQEDS